MSDQKNLVIAIALSLAILLGFQYLYQPTPPPQSPEQQTAAQGGQGASGTADSAPPSVPGGVAGSIPPSAPSGEAAREAMLEQSPRLPILSKRLKGTLNLRGARLDDLDLRDYKRTIEKDSKSVTLLSPSGAALTYFIEFGWAPVGNVKVPGQSTVWSTDAKKLNGGAPVTLRWDNGEGLLFERIVSVDDNFMFTVIQRVTNSSDQAVHLHPYGLVSRRGLPKLLDFFILHEGPVGVLQGTLKEYDYDDLTDEEVPAKKVDSTGGWLGITDKYWAAVIVPDQNTPFQGRFSGSVINTKPHYQTDYLASAVQVPAGGKSFVEGLLFAGAKEVDVVDANAEQHKIDRFDLLIDWGWFYFLTKPLYYALDYFYKLVGNYGLAILIVTVLIKLALFPLANKSYVSMSKMKKLQPEMERIKTRFGDDKTRQQQALMDLYKKEKVNPASGCLPILVQIPVFFALYKVLFVTIEMRHAPFYGWIRDLSAPDPTTLFNLFGLIPWSPPEFLTIGIWPLIMGVSMFVQMRLNPAPPDPVQAKIFAWMPVIFTFLLAPFPAGLVIYWAWNNTLSIAQQAFIMKRQGVPITLFENIGLKKKSAGGKS